MLTAVTVERIAYRPLRKAPRLTPLISAIGASFFLQQAMLNIFGPAKRAYTRPKLIDGTIKVQIGDLGTIPVTKTGIIVVIVSLVLMVLLYLFVQRSKTGRAMRAVAEDKNTAALMGVDVDRVIVITFALGALLAGAAGVMMGFHNQAFNFRAGFIPGLKAFTAAVLGGIGNIPGAMFGGFFLGLVEALGPTMLGIPAEYKDVIAFSAARADLDLPAYGYLWRSVGGKEGLAMMQRRIQPFIDSLRTGAVAGFAVGMVIIFLILVGVPINLDRHRPVLHCCWFLFSSGFG